MQVIVKKINADKRVNRYCSIRNIFLAKLFTDKFLTLPFKFNFAHKKIVLCCQLNHTRCFCSANIFCDKLTLR